MNARPVWLALALIAAASARAEEQLVPLREAPGQQVVEDNCGSCHSLDYLRTNSLFLDRKGWQSEVSKMTSACYTGGRKDDRRLSREELRHRRIARPAP